MNILWVGISVVFWAVEAQGQCNLGSCVQTGTVPFTVLVCSDYKRMIQCLQTKLNQCTGSPTSSEIFTATQALNQPSNCVFDPANMGDAMTARTTLMSTLMSKAPPGMPPFFGMGDDGPFDDGPFDDGPFDDGPFDDGPFDDMGGMMAGFFPGVLGGVSPASGSSAASSAAGTSGPTKQRKASRFVNPRSSGNSVMVTSSQSLAITLCILVLRQLLS